jgi:hypothetical protein
MRAAHPRTLLTWVGIDDPMEMERVDRAAQRRPAQRHDTFTIGVIEHGVAQVRYRGQVETHRPGGVIVIAPGEVHAYAPQPGGCWGHRIVRPSAALLRRFAHPSGAPSATTAPTPSFARSWYADEELAGRLVSVHALLEDAARVHPDDAHALVEPLLSEVLGTLVRRHALGDGLGLATTTRADDADDGARRAVHRAIDFLHAHLGEPVCLAQLAEVAGMRPFALIRGFGRVVGVPPGQYVRAHAASVPRRAARRVA